MAHTTRVTACLTVFVAVFLLLANPAAAQADEPKPDVVKLVGGQELAGTIVKELSGYVWLDMGDGQAIFLTPDKIREIVRSVPLVVEHNKYELADEYIIEPWERAEGVTRAVVLTAEDMVGMHMSDKPLREVIPMLHEEGIDLVVIKIKSGAGYLLESQQLSDVLHNEYKQEFELVGWVDSATSAAGALSMTFEEMYFMPHGHFGLGRGCWGGYLDLGKAAGVCAELIRTIALRGGKEGSVVEAMLQFVELSYSIDQMTGKVIYFDNLSGDHILSDGTDWLVLNSDEAEHCGFSSGTAATLEELAALLESEHGTIEWVGKDIEGIPYPVCKAERHQVAYREVIDYQDARFGEMLIQYSTEIANAQGVVVDRRSGYLRKAERLLIHIAIVLQDYPEFGLANLPDGWLAAQAELIRELREE